MNESTDLAFIPSPTPSHRLEESCPSSLATLVGSYHCAPTAPLQAVVMLTHGPAGDRELLQGRAWSHHPWVPGALRGPPRSVELCRADSCAREAAAGTLPGIRLPSPATAQPDRGKVGQFSLPAQAALGPTGPAPEGARRRHRRPGSPRAAAVTTSPWCSSATEAG